MNRSFHKPLMHFFDYGLTHRMLLTSSPFRLVLSTGLVLLAVGCQSLWMEQCSISGILNNPQRYEGRRVMVQGILRKGPEHIAIYSSEVSARAIAAESGLWIEVSSRDAANAINPLPDFSEIVIGGTIQFPRDGAGHFNHWKAQIAHIVAIVVQNEEPVH